MSIKNRILKAKDVPTKTVAVDEWEVSVELRSMSGRMRAKVAEVIATVGDTETEAGKMKFGAAATGLFSEVVADALYDPESGEKVFTAPEDVAALGEKNPGVLQRLAIEVFNLSGLNAKAVDEAGKSSSSTPSDASTSS